jgi:signal transduction histidine kinase/ligand-binding sensor domain-containing protein
MSACRSYAVFFSLCVLLGAVERIAYASPRQGAIQFSLTQWGHRDGLQSTTIYAIAQTPDGFLWLGTADGLIRFDGIRFYRIPRSDQEPPFGRVRALAVTADGTLWVGTESGALVRINGRVMKSLSLARPISSIHERADASLDVRTPTESFRIAPETLQIVSTCGAPPAAPKAESACDLPIAPGVSRSILDDAHLAADQIRSVLADSDGRLWLATAESGVFRISTAGKETAGVEQIAATDGLSSDSVWTVFEDREHNFWIGTQNGLNRLRHDKFFSITRRTGLVGSNVEALAAVGGELFAGSALGLEKVIPATAESLSRDRILSLAACADGSLLAGTAQGLVLIENGRPRRVALGSALLEITSIAQSATGEIWFHDQQQGLFRWRPGAAPAHVDVPAMRDKGVTIIQADAGGGVWFGLSTGDVVFYDGAAFRVLTRADALPGGMPHSIAVDNEGLAWIASERGLARCGPTHCLSWSKENGLPVNRVLWAVPGKDGRLWLGYSIGVASMPIQDLLHAAVDRKFPVPHNLYDDGDGLHSSPEVRGASPVIVLPDGRIWFITTEGLAGIDPADIRTNTIPPPAHVEQITVDDVDVNPPGPITLPPRTRRIEITYTGLSFTDPRKVTFRYRLVGFDPVWHAVSTRFATYTNLPPGDYRFEVLAANDDGVWSTEPATLRFTLSAALYQTRWFAALCAAGVIGAVVLLIRFRIRSAADRLRLRFEERLDERTRVAQDLHDHLIQEVMGLSLQLEIADELTPPDAAGKPVLGRALQISESALANGREALTTLRSTTLRPQDVMQALERVAAHFPAAATRVHLATEGAGQPLRAGIGDEIVQIACEGLRNALRHTAGRVDVRVIYAPSRISISIADEGPGMSPSLLETGVAGHYGLTGMRERAARIGASLTIESTPTAGTRVRLAAGRVAYHPSAAPRGMWAKLKEAWL